MSTSENKNHKGTQREDEWIIGSENIECKGEQAICKSKGVCSAYGKAVVSSGRAQWDIRIDFESFGGICVGVYKQSLRDKDNLTLLPLTEHFGRNENGYGFSNKTGYKINNGNDKQYGNKFRHGDILTISLDLTSQTLTYSINSKSQGVAFDNIPRGAYRLALKLQFPEQKVSILGFWTSLADEGTEASLADKTIVNNNEPNSILDYDKPLIKGSIIEVEEDNVSPMEKLDESDHKISENNESNGNISSIQLNNEKKEDKETDQEKLAKEKFGSQWRRRLMSDSLLGIKGVENIGQSIEKDDDINNYNESSSPSTLSDNSIWKNELHRLAIEAGVDPSRIPEDLKKNIKKSNNKTNEERTSIKKRRFSLNDLKLEIAQQAKAYPNDKNIHSNGNNDDEKNLISQNSVDVIELIEPRSRSRASSRSSSSIPEPIHILTVEDDVVDCFVICGHNIKIDPQVVTCIRESPEGSHSAFGAQVVTRGRMEWIIKIEQGHSMQIGISGLTHTASENFTNSPYGYGYGDDGNIYNNGQLIEYGAPYNAGDTIGIYLDMDKGTLSFTLNGEAQGDSAAFEDITTDEENGIFGYRLAICLSYRPHRVRLLESIMWSTKRLSPRPETNNNDLANFTPGRKLTWTSTPTNITPRRTSEANGGTPREMNSIAKKDEIKDLDSKEKENKNIINSDKENTKDTSKLNKTSSKTKLNKRDSNEKNQTNGTSKLQKSFTTTQIDSKPLTKTSSLKSSNLPKSSSNKNLSSNEKPKKSLTNNHVNPKNKTINWIKRDRVKIDIWETCGRKLQIEKNTIRANNDITDSNSGIGKLVVSNNQKAEWEIKIDQGDYLALGIVSIPPSSLQSSKTRKLLSTFFSTDLSGFSYYSNDGGKMHAGKHKKYGESYKTGDIINIKLDMIEHILSFSKNANDQGIAFKNIPHGEYRIAVMMNKKWHKVTILNASIWDIDK